MESPPNGTGPKFELGQVVATPGAIELLVGAGRSRFWVGSDKTALVCFNIISHVRASNPATTTRM
jgi:hypothetical protein